MSKRHAASRRRTYGRRQHELHERMDRRADRVAAERAWRSGHDIGLDTVSHLESSSEHPYGFAD